MAGGLYVESVKIAALAGPLRVVWLNTAGIPVVVLRVGEYMLPAAYYCRAWECWFVTAVDVESEVMRANVADLQTHEREPLALLPSC